MLGRGLAGMDLRLALLPVPMRVAVAYISQVKLDVDHSLNAFTLCKARLDSCFSPFVHLSNHLTHGSKVVTPGT